MAVDNLILVYKSATILHLHNRSTGHRYYFVFIYFDTPGFLELKKITWVTTKVKLNAGLRSTSNKGRKIRIS